MTILIYHSSTAKNKDRQQFSENNEKVWQDIDTANSAGTFRENELD